MPKRKSKDSPRRHGSVRYGAAIHEASHTVIAWMEPALPAVERVSIVPKRDSIGRARIRKDPAWRFRANEADLRALIRSYLASIVGERLFLGAHTIGCITDLQNATSLARKIVCEAGMDQVGFGLIALSESTESESTRARADLAIKMVIAQCYAQVEKAVRRHRKKILRVAAELLRHRTLRKQHLTALLGPKPHEAPKTKRARRK